MILTNETTKDSQTITEANRWSWFRIIRAVVCPFCEIVTQVTNLFGSNRGNLNGISSDELTIIANFLQNRLVAFLNTYAGEADRIIKSGSLSEIELAKLNHTINLLCMIRTYFAMTKDANLSDAAWSFRNLMLFKMLDDIQNKITDYITNYYPDATPIATTVNAANYDLSMIIDKPINANFECITYIPSLTPTIAKRTVAAVQSVAATIAPEVKTEPKKSNTAIIVTIFGLVVGIAIVAANNDEKSNKSKSKS